MHFCHTWFRARFKSFVFRGKEIIPMAGKWKTFSKLFKLIFWALSAKKIRENDIEPTPLLNPSWSASEHAFNPHWMSQFVHCIPCAFSYEHVTHLENSAEAEFSLGIPIWDGVYKNLDERELISKFRLSELYWRFLFNPLTPIWRKSDSDTESLENKKNG